MSFLNPVNEPVLRFSSADAGAPQINYNSRVAGDVKAVLKACLVTGYGATESAGWSIVNEVGHVAEFVSPSVAMSDYRLGINDTSTSSTTWYYQYKDVRTNPAYNSPIKAITGVDKTHASNGWYLFATARGLIFIEALYSTFVNKLSTRITYFSQVKSGVVATTGANIMFFNIGHSSAIGISGYLYNPTYPHFQLESYDKAQVFSANPQSATSATYSLGVSNIDIASAMYITPVARDVVLAEITGILMQVVNNPDDIYGVKETTASGRPVLSVCAGYSTSTTAFTLSYGRTFLIYLDYWEY